MESRLNAYATVMSGRPIVRDYTSTAIQAMSQEHKYPTQDKVQDKPVVITRSTGYNLWQWLKKFTQTP